MTNNVKELLPIGSVIRLKGAKKYLMIFGVCQTDSKYKKDYDYIGCIWPEGSIGDKTQVLFDHVNVEEVAFTGMDNEVRQEFIERLDNYYASRK